MYFSCEFGNIRAKSESTMKRIISVVSAAAIAVTSLATSIVPASAVPIVPVQSTNSSDVIKVQTARHQRGEVRRHFNRRHFSRDRHRPGWYHGHRGHRHYRRGYRRHSDGWWYPLAAFGAGAIIGGAIANQPAPRGVSNSHVEWCYARYRSYRASDNTFQPYNGPRRACISPYS